MGHVATAESPRVAEGTVASQSRSRRRRLRPALMVGGVLVVVVAALGLYLRGGAHVATDDAYVDADKLAVSTDVSGIVADVAVRQGEQVAKGQVLFRLDPEKFKIAAAGAKADLAQTALTIASMKQDYARTEKNITAAKATLAQDQRTLQRDTWLRKAGGVPTATYEDARYRVVADHAHVAAFTAAAAVELAKLGGALDLPLTQVPQYQAAEAKLSEARRELRHAVVQAPFAGVVTEVSKLQPGMYLPAGAAAFGLVSTEHVWVKAEPKETQLTWVRPGNPVQVSVDTYPGRTWHGTVESLNPAVGSEFALLPAQNSSGNWVKVVQRIPVRIRLDQQAGAPPLRDGMSVEVSIATGHHRHLSDLW